MAMRMYDIIDKKKKGSELTPEEITYMVEGYVAGEIPDYQVSAFLMAVYYEGMSEKELSVFTDSIFFENIWLHVSAVMKCCRNGPAYISFFNQMSDPNLSHLLIH